MERDDLNRFLAMVRRTRFIDYVEPMGQTAEEALEVRLKWAERSKDDPAHAEEAEFLLEHRDALLEILEADLEVEDDWVSVDDPNSPDGLDSSDAWGFGAAVRAAEDAAAEDAETEEIRRNRIDEIPDLVVDEPHPDDLRTNITRIEDLDRADEVALARTDTDEVEIEEIPPIRPRPVRVAELPDEPLDGFDEDDDSHDDLPAAGLGDLPPDDDTTEESEAGVIITPAEAPTTPQPVVRDEGPGDVPDAAKPTPEPSVEEAMMIAALEAAMQLEADERASALAVDDDDDDDENAATVVMTNPAALLDRTPVGGIPVTAVRVGSNQPSDPGESPMPPRLTPRPVAPPPPIPTAIPPGPRRSRADARRDRRRHRHRHRPPGGSVRPSPRSPVAWSPSCSRQRRSR